MVNGINSVAEDPRIPLRITASLGHKYLLVRHNSLEQRRAIKSSILVYPQGILLKIVVFHFLQRRRLYATAQAKKS